MRMTLHSDYGLRMLTYLAARPEQPCTVSEIAGVYGLSRNHLLKVALRLKNGGFVRTSRGRAGGLRLAKPPQEVVIGAVVRCLEEDFVIVECFREGGSCIIAPACRLKGIFGEALAAYMAVLDRYTLKTVIDDAAALRPLLGLDLSPPARENSRSDNLPAAMDV